MHIKLIVPAIAIASAGALAAGVGSASAAEPFTTLEGIPVEAMSAGEMAVVRGSGLAALHIHLPGNAGGVGVVAIVITSHMHNDSFLFNDGLEDAPTGVIHNVFHDIHG